MCIQSTRIVIICMAEDMVCHKIYSTALVMLTRKLCTNVSLIIVFPMQYVIMWGGGVWSG